METGAINPVGQNAISRGTKALEELGEDYTTFLKLLTAQVSNQDPLEPIDSTTFVTQLAQLTQVEQAAQTNIQLENLASKLDAMALMSGSSLLGQRVSFASNSLVLDEDGASASYRLDSNAKTVVAEIYGPNGIPVKTINGLSGEAGIENNFYWNGQSDSGQQALRGNYQVKFRAADDLGNPIEVSLFRESKIQEVKLESGIIAYLVDGGEYISPVEIEAIR